MTQKTKGKPWNSHPGSPSVKKFKTVASAWQVTLTNFGDVRSINYIEFMPKRITINSKRYCETLRALKERICRIRSEIRASSLPQENAKPHCSQGMIETVAGVKFTLVLHTSYSP